MNIVNEYKVETLPPSWGAAEMEAILNRHALDHWVLTQVYEPFVILERKRDVKRSSGKDRGAGSKPAPTSEELTRSPAPK